MEIKKSYLNKIYIKNMKVIVHYPLKGHDNKISHITEFYDYNNTSGFVCKVDEEIFDPAFLEPLEYPNKILELLYGKK